MSRNSLPLVRHVDVGSELDVLERSSSLARDTEHKVKTNSNVMRVVGLGLGWGGVGAGVKGLMAKSRTFRPTLAPRPRAPLAPSSRFPPEKMKLGVTSLWSRFHCGALLLFICLPSCQ